MVGGPDDGLTGSQGGAMGESWSDLVALEYLHAHGFVPVDGENPWAEGPYVTGNKKTGIRDYALDANPLNYSDVGFDLTGPEVHADGEIWNAVNYDLRQALVRKYDGAFPEGDRALQLRCADGRPGTSAPEAPLPPEQCPGNRRWIQIVFDAFLLQQGDTSMLTRATPTSPPTGCASAAPTRPSCGTRSPSAAWASPPRPARPRTTSRSRASTPRPPNEATVTFATTDAGTQAAIPATLYVGRYEARATPVADTDPSTPLGRDGEARGRHLRRARPLRRPRPAPVPAHGRRRPDAQPAYALTPNVASKSQGASASGGGTTTTT